MPWCTSLITEVLTGESIRKEIAMDALEERNSLRAQVKAEAKYIDELRAAADKAESLTARQSFLDSARDNEKRLARLEFKLHAAEERLNRESKGSLWYVHDSGCWQAL